MGFEAEGWIDGIWKDGEFGEEKGVEMVVSF